MTLLAPAVLLWTIGRVIDEGKVTEDAMKTIMKLVEEA